MGEAERVFTAAGRCRTTMDMVLRRHGGRGVPGVQVPELDPADRARTTCSSTGSRSPGRAATGSSSRGRSAPGTPTADTLAALDAYHEYFEAAQATMKAGATAHDVHRAVSKGFLDRGFTLGHVTGHSIGMTMIEHPRIGEGIEIELRENMVVSMHPHAITAGRAHLPVHAGHMARRPRRRRAVLGRAAADLRRLGGRAGLELEPR